MWCSGRQVGPDSFVSTQAAGGKQHPLPAWPLLPGLELVDHVVPSCRRVDRFFQPEQHPGQEVEHGQTLGDPPAPRIPLLLTQKLGGLVLVL